MVVGIESQLDDQRDYRIWIAAIAAAILAHVLLFAVHPHWTLPSVPARVEVQQIDPRKLEAIRKEWKEREKSLLLDKNKSQPGEKEAPRDARYMSDKNIRVEKEQRARETNVIPQTGAQAEQKAASPKTSKSLSRLGLPMDLSAPKEAAAAERARLPVLRHGGDQAIPDKSLPEGAENMLNAQESIYYSFNERLYQAIGPLWQSNISKVPQRRLAPGEYVTTIDLVLDREGNLADIRYLRTSGIADFDRAVETTIRKIERFPNPPRGLLDETGNVHVGFSFTVQIREGAGFEFAPPERNY